MQYSATQSATHAPRNGAQNSDYLHRRNRSPYWYVRKRIPDDLLGHAALASTSGKAKTELTKSTGKAAKRDAAVVADQILRDWELLFASLRGHPNPTIQPPMDVPLQEFGFDFSFAGANKDRLESLFDYLIGLNLHQSKYCGRENNSFRDDYIARKINRLSIGEVDALNRPMSKEDYQSLWLAAVQRETGSSAQSRQFAHIMSRAIDKKAGVTFGEVLKEYKERRKADGAQQKALKNIDRVANIFADECLPNGLKTLQASVTKQQANEFVKIAQQVWPGRKTCADAISLLSTIFNHGMKVLDASEKNPFKYAVSTLPKANRGVRKARSNEAYDNDQLSAMLPSLAKFSSKGRSEATLMVLPVTLLALYTGMRIEEICSLKVSDVRSVDGIDYIAVSKSKSNAGIREIPLNRGSEIVVSWLKKHSKNNFLISGLTEYDGRRSKKVSDRFAGWKSEFYPDDSHKRMYTFHSFRSTAITALDRGEVSNDFISLLVGHEDGRGTLAKSVYSAGRTMRSLVEPASKIDYGDELYNLAVKLLSNHHVIPV
jgi:integrase